MRFIAAIIILVSVVSKANAQCETLAFSDYSQGKVFLMENGKITWQHDAPESNDMTVLPNGNILFSIGKGVLEMTTKNDTVFHYSSKSGIFACQRLKNGNTFIGECNSGRLLEVSKNGVIVKDICILPQGVADGGHAFMRNARKLDNGNYLVAHYGSQRVTEYNDKGETVWNIEVPGGPHTALRLPNGNTLVSVADMTQNSRIVELDKDGNIVWEVNNKDLGGEYFKFLGGMHYLDGQIMVANWLGHGQEGKSSHIFLIDREKNVICKLDKHPNIQTVSSVYRYKDVNKKNSKKSVH